jgi:hypothetical protein
MTPPGFDQHLGLGEALEDLAIEQFVAKGSVEPKAGTAQPLVVAVLPG